MILVVVFPAAVPLGEDDDEEEGAEAADAAPEPEDAADNGLDLSPVPVLVEGSVLAGLTPVRPPSGRVVIGGVLVVAPKNTKEKI